jgi:uncharacterized protein DUF3857
MQQSNLSEAPVSPQAAAERFVRGPAPSWVETIEGPFASESNGATSWLLLDEQFNLTGVYGEFTRQICRADNATGVDAISVIHLQFNPTYQKLTLHGVTILRDGRMIDALEDADIDFLRVEHDMYARVYRGDYEVVIQIRGLEPGDIVDYAYTIDGSNPIFAGRPTLRVRNTFSIHLGRRFLRFLLPRDKSLEFDLRGPPQAFETRVLDSHIEHRVDVRAPERHEYEGYVPSEFNEQSTIFQVSSFRSWRNVADWAVELYATADDDPFVAALAERFLNQTAMPPEQAAIAFVQEGIRYVATSYGEGGFRPRPLEVLAKRRYGDCKDKSRLLAAVLRKLGHEADPALVNTNRPRGLFADRASPVLFNHVIVKACIHGEQVWIDATDSGQRGPLALRGRPHGMAALVIRPGTADLERIPELPPNLYGCFSDSATDLTGGVGSPATHEGEEKFIGETAEYMRRQIAAGGVDDMRRDWEESNSRNFGEVEYERFEVSDDEQANTFTVRFRLLMRDPWRPNPDGSHSFRATICYATTLLPDIGVGGRQLPLMLNQHPVHHRHVERYILPRGHRPLDLKSSRQQRRNSGFEFIRTDTLLEDQLVLDVETKTLAYHLPAEEALSALRDQTVLQRGHLLELNFPAEAG